jgi:hypothetical protein
MLTEKFREKRSKVENGCRDWSEVDKEEKIEEK